MTPETVHYGRAAEVHKWRSTLDAAFVRLTQSASRASPHNRQNCPQQPGSISPKRNHYPENLATAVL
jgi:hypothetical protein